MTALETNAINIAVIGNTTNIDRLFSEKIENIFLNKSIIKLLLFRSQIFFISSWTKNVSRASRVAFLSVTHVLDIFTLFLAVGRIAGRDAHTQHRTNGDDQPHDIEHCLTHGAHTHR